MYFWMDWREEPARFFSAWMAATIMSEYLGWSVDFLEALARLGLAAGVDVEFSVMVACLVLLLKKAPSKGPALVGNRGKPASGSALAPLAPRPVRGRLSGTSVGSREELAGPGLRGPASPVCRSVSAPGSASASASASSASLFPAPRLALGRRIRVFSGGGRTAVRTGLLAACSRPGMAPRRRHLCFFR